MVHGQFRAGAPFVLDECRQTGSCAKSRRGRRCSVYFEYANAAQHWVEVASRKLLAKVCCNLVQSGRLLGSKMAPLRSPLGQPAGTGTLATLQKHAVDAIVVFFNPSSVSQTGRRGWWQPVCQPQPSLIVLNPPEVFREVRSWRHDPRMNNDAAHSWLRTLMVKYGEGREVSGALVDGQSGAGTSTRSCSAAAIGLLGSFDNPIRIVTWAMRPMR
jgi:hypothetical protein